MPEDIDTRNDFGVAINAGNGNIVVLLHDRLRRDISPEEALNLAAWLVTLADPLQKRFPAVLEAVQES